MGRFLSAMTFLLKHQASELAQLSMFMLYANWRHALGESVPVQWLTLCQTIVAAHRCDVTAIPWNNW